MNSKRNLTSEEIKDILSEISYPRSSNRIFYDTYLSVEKKIKTKLLSQLSSVLIYPSKIPDLKKEIIKQFHSSLVSPGESVGVIAAQSIGERQTQTTLSAFHVAGVSTATVTTGVPRFSELLSATKKPKHKTSTLFFKESNTQISELRKRVGAEIACLSLEDISQEINIFLSPPKDEYFKVFEIIHSSKFRGYNSGITFILNKAKIFEYNLSLQKISELIEDNYDDITCVWSPIELARIDVFVDTKGISEEILFINRENSVSIYIETIILEFLRKIKICGIDGISNIFFIPDKEYKDSTSSPKDSTSSRWAIETEGSNLSKVLQLDIIDKTRSISNDMWEIYSIFGIEAARQFLIDEYTKVVSSDGTWINPRHIQLLVDMMTFTGIITSVSRYGISKDQASPLARASFEISVENFIRSGVYGEVENNKGVSASIISGKVPKIGTGGFEVKLDIKKLIE